MKFVVQISGEPKFANGDQFLMGYRAFGGDEVADTALASDKFRGLKLGKKSTYSCESLNNPPQSGASATLASPKRHARGQDDGALRASSELVMTLMIMMVMMMRVTSDDGGDGFGGGLGVDDDDDDEDGDGNARDATPAIPDPDKGGETGGSYHRRGKDCCRYSRVQDSRSRLDELF